MVSLQAKLQRTQDLRSGNPSSDVMHMCGYFGIVTAYRNQIKGLLGLLFGSGIMGLTMVSDI